MKYVNIIIILICSSCISLPVKQNNDHNLPPVVSEIVVPFSQDVVSINSTPQYKQPMDVTIYILIIVIILGVLPHILATMHYMLEYIYMYIKQYCTK